jgi:3-deoxy-D-manno-octulosonic-acid transferase
VVLDTVGELAVLFQIATVVFLGGSLVRGGGHNVLEPAVWGKPVVFGPHMENFAEIAELFLTNRAACQIPSADALEPTLSTLLGDPVRRAALGAAARALVEANRGATERSLSVMATLLEPDPTGYRTV